MRIQMQNGLEANVLFLVSEGITSPDGVIVYAAQKEPYEVVELNDIGEAMGVFCPFCNQFHLVPRKQAETKFGKQKVAHFFVMECVECDIMFDVSNANIHMDLAYFKKRARQINKRR